jgi:two-component system sensor kinase FixL
MASADSLFQALIATAVDGMVVIDAEGIVEVYNPACERLFGYAADEVIGRNVAMLMPAPYREAHDGYIAAYRRTGIARIIGIGREVVGRRKDGSTFPMYLSVGEGSVGERPIFVGIIHDISNRRDAERRLQDLQAELLHVSRLTAMGQMSSGLAHELNQPLTAIMNYIKAARRTVEAVEDPRVARALELVDKAAAQTQRAGQIIRRLRDFVEKGETHRRLEDINATVAEAVALGLAGGGDVERRFDYAPGLADVMIDRIQIQQVVLNLVRNAVEAMAGCARRELRIATALVDGMVEITVADTGPGLPPEILDRLFQPFVTTKENGMGIGLSLCRTIADAHGGELTAATGEQGGAVFRIRLPVPVR